MREPSAGRRSTDGSGAELAERLRSRRPEIETATATRVYAISDPRGVADGAYLEGLNAAMSAAIEYRLAVLELGERRAPAIPDALLAQARLDARDGVALDTVMRRYFAGTSLFGDFLVREAESAGVPSSALPGLLAAQTTVGDRLLAAVSAEYGREAAARPRSAVDRRRECAKALIAGELVDTSELGYELAADHLGLMAKGERAPEAMRRLAEMLDRRLLVVTREEEPVSAVWLGGSRPLGTARVIEALGEVGLEGVAVSVGEPAAGLAGWRSSHAQAKAALALVDDASRQVVRYADFILLATVMRDEVAVRTLREICLEPLGTARDGGVIARQTLRAYFAAERNVSSTAALLGINRRTVANRIGAIEELLGRPLSELGPELETALRIEEVEAS
jgi:PucR C-terminal helix-turn-helix domain/GGDEF-like domain